MSIIKNMITLLTWAKSYKIKFKSSSHKEKNKTYSFKAKLICSLNSECTYPQLKSAIVAGSWWLWVWEQKLSNRQQVTCLSVLGMWEEFPHINQQHSHWRTPAWTNPVCCTGFILRLLNNNNKNTIVIITLTILLNITTTIIIKTLTRIISIEILFFFLKKKTIANHLPQ